MAVLVLVLVMFGAAIILVLFGASPAGLEMLLNTLLDALGAVAMIVSYCWAGSSAGSNPKDEGLTRLKD